MLKTCYVALLAIAVPIGVAQARHVIPGCVVGQPAARICNCHSGHPPLLCHRGQWCRPSSVMAEGPECR